MMELDEKLSKARDLVEQSEFVRVISHHDVDGISAAAIITNFLRNKKKGFLCSLLKNVELKSIFEEENELFIICDMGSADIESAEASGKNIIILDHHQPLRESKSERVVQINSHLHGINGSSEACGSTMAYLFAGDLNLISFMISGALGDRQGTDFKGLNRRLVDEAIEKKAIDQKMSLTIDCYDNKNLQRMVESSIAPFFKGLSGRSADIVKEVEKKSEKATNSFLLALLMEQGCREDVVSDLIGYVYRLPLGMSSQELYSLLNVCDGLDMAEKGLAMALGDKESYEEIVKRREQYYKRAIAGLASLEEKGAVKMEGLQYFYCDDLGMSGLYCGIGMRYIFDQSVPALALTKTKDHTKISARGTRYLIKKGLNLAMAMKKAAGKVNGSGGGHDIAAGATIPSGMEEEFLMEANRILKGPYDQI
ncbi:MAG: DHH family phosphoesterase [Candidatus Thermoplasmatota archaeon]|nr:DHH family phosphoesterase [Candidatus Thermoplasmatota archaeon]